MIYCVLLNPAVDVIYETEALSLGSTVTGLRSTSVPAGKGLNVARAVSMLGESATLVSIIPQAGTVLFEEAAATDGIRTHFIEVPGRVRTNTTVLESISGRVTHLNAVAAPVPSYVEQDILAVITSLAFFGDVWVLAGSVPPGISLEIYAKIIEILKHAGCVVVLDTSGEALRLGLAAGPTTVMPNRYEASALIGAPCPDDPAVARAADAILQGGVKSVLVTMGAQGGFAARTSEQFFVRIPPIVAVDSVGCGDAAAAGMAVGLHRNLDFKDRARYATAAAMSAALHKGPGIIEKDEVIRFIERIVFEDVLRAPTGGMP